MKNTHAPQINHTSRNTAHRSAHAAFAITILLAASTPAFAQVPVNGVTFTRLTQIVPFTSVLTNPAAASLPPSPGAAYSSLNVSPGLPSGSSGGQFSIPVFDDITVAPSAVGQRVQSIRVGLAFMREPPPGQTTTFSLTSRLQMAFWNADGLYPQPGGNPPVVGGPGTPLIQNGTHVSYLTNSFTMVSRDFGLVTLDLGSNGFTLPAGKFYIGMALEITGPTTSAVGGMFSLYGPPVVGSSDATYWRAADPEFENGIPFGAGFPNSSAPGTFPLGPRPGFDRGLGIELVIPSPGVGAFLACSLVISSRRRRTS